MKPNDYNIFESFNYEVLFHMFLKDECFTVKKNISKNVCLKFSMQFLLFNNIILQLSKKKSVWIVLFRMMEIWKIEKQYIYYFFFVFLI